MPRPTSAADATKVRVAIVTLDGHLASAVQRAERLLRRELPGLELRLHALAEWSGDPDARERCLEDIEKADIVLATMLFMEDHIQSVLPALQARRDSCDAMVACMSAGDVIKLTRLGDLRMDGEAKGIVGLLKRLRGAKKKGGGAGAQQVAMLRRLPKILRYIPGTAQDLRAYFLTLQYWMSGSDEDVANMVRFLLNRYAAGERAHFKGALNAGEPQIWPDTGLYHPRCKARITERLSDLPKPKGPLKGTVGLLIMRSYVLAGNSKHYDGVIAALEARGLKVVPAFASGLDARPAIERFFMKDGKATVDALLSLTGFSLVGGPAYNDKQAAEEALAGLDVPYVAAHALEFQSLETWNQSTHGLTPVEATMMVAIPELDGAISPMIFGGRSDAAADGRSRDMTVHEERAEKLAARIEAMVRLRKTPKAERKLAIVLFNFPPNSGSTGTAAYLSVFASLMNTLKALKAEGYDVDLPESLDALRQTILKGNAATFGADANVLERIPTDTHLRRQPWLKEIEAAWGPAPGKHNSDGASIHVLGASFGKVVVGVQPAFGYEGDPMRLLFEGGMAPTHAFAAFYDYLREDFGADAVLHFGTHGALEFMPGKQTALSGACWPDRLIGSLPNFYLYAANNPSEGAIAKRRSGATLVSYLTPPVAKAGLYKELEDLKASIETRRHLKPTQSEELAELAALIAEQAAGLDLVPAGEDWAGEDWAGDPEAGIDLLRAKLRELEETLIPYDMHTLGEPFAREQRIELLDALEEPGGEPGRNAHVSRAALEILVDGGGLEAARRKDLECGGAGDRERLAALAHISGLLAENREIPSLMHALDGGFVRPAPGGDLLRKPEIMPTGRNINAFDPYGLPSAFSVAQGARQAERILQRHLDEGKSLPESVALVLWGTDNLKSEGTPIGIALALVGAKPRFDGYKRLVGAELLPLESLGRPRIDAVVTLSGIFRDLLPLQTKLLAEAFYLAAAAEEPEEQNFVRKHALAYMAKHEGCSLETAALRIFSNAEGAYGANVNHLIDSGAWDEEDELSNAFMTRKSFAYGMGGKPLCQRELMSDLFSSRILNPKWYESMLSHGHEGVRQIEAHITNTFGWSATADAVAPWVYEKVTEKFLLDEDMRKRMAALNPVASARLANRLLEASERRYWQPDEATQASLQEAGEELEDRVEGINGEVAA
ncbi:MAG: magnesium chelatase subunit H [Limibacillus sp.]